MGAVYKTGRTITPKMWRVRTFIESLLSQDNISIIFQKMWNVRTFIESLS
ncbi:hypothetical protein [European catfish virus]|uniref:Uncharacterized protein n=1 Tax=European catfish virus TaxID=84739 RepID=I2BFP1_9VIRU|nr:hypothetical protein A190_gp061 [European catfish virus]AFJ52344.1 hypothetical protein [European catfish virus]AMZ04890.1 hypothetical protein [European catfish virus]AMZ05026.1 hypothetical protein [European catfish virus]